MYAPDATANPEQNYLLCALPAGKRELLLQQLRPVTLSLGQVVVEAHDHLSHAYFLTDSIVSLLYTTKDGASAEMGIVGNEGMLGTAIFLGGDSTSSRAVVAVAGNAFRIPAKLLLEEFERNLVLQRVLLRYTQALITQISQTAACNRLHSVEQRLCRWLLMCHDRTNRADICMTQELIAHMLGGRRESVTVAAGNLQDRGLIHYCRGRINILDRNGLEASTCECYRVVESEIDHLYGRKCACSVSKHQEPLEEAG